MPRPRTKIMPHNTLLPVGAQFLFDDHQVYTVIGHDTYVSKSTGTTFDRVLWSAPCATCGVTIEVSSLPDKWPAQRRCQAHKRRGKVVTNEVRQARRKRSDPYAYNGPTYPSGLPHFDEDGKPLPDFVVWRRQLRGESEEAFAGRMAKLDAWERAQAEAADLL